LKVFKGREKDIIRGTLKFGIWEGRGNISWIKGERGERSHEKKKEQEGPATRWKKKKSSTRGNS